jgi:uncharacterized protein
VLTKSVPFDFKSIDDAGTFEATVAVFNNVDKGGDRIIPGAFEKTLAKWNKSGDPIPVIFNHDWASPMAHIGVVESAKETASGLWVKGRLDIEDNEVARQVHRLMSRRSLREFSFGYAVPPGGERRAKDGANELLEIELAEVGPTLKGMNPSTELHAVKSALGVPIDQDELREQSRRLEQEVAESTLPEIKATSPAAAAAEDAPVDLTNELQDVKDRLAALETALDDVKKKADVTDKEPKARSVDPLRKRSEELALEIASVGLDLQPPAQVKQDKRPEDHPSEEEIRRRSRDLMFEVLSTTTGVDSE